MIKIKFSIKVTKDTRLNVRKKVGYFDRTINQKGHKASISIEVINRKRGSTQRLTYKKIHYHF